MVTGLHSAALGGASAFAVALILATSAAAAMPTTAGAPTQAQAQAPATAAEAGATLSTVIVTAERREQSAQDVGVAVSVLSGQTLALRGVTTLESLQYQTPSLEITPQFGTGQTGFRLRGVGFDDYASNNSSPVGVYIDEVAYPFPVQTTGQIFDVSRVEVLRGPQGTLYGRNSTGGAINILDNLPTATFHSGLDLEGGSYGYARGEGFLSGPITDTVKARVSIISETGGGFQRNRVTGQEIGDLDRASARLQLQWDPLARFTARLEGSYGYDYSDGQGLYRFNEAGGDADHSSQTGWGASQSFANLIGASPDTKPFRHNENYGLDLHLGYDLGFARLTSISGYHLLSRREYEDFDATPAADADEFFDTHAKVFSQEARLTSSGQGPLKYQAGVYYDKEDLSDVFLSDFVDEFGFVADTRYRQHADTVALFGQADYAVTQRLSVTAGLRGEYERRTLDDFSTTTVPAAIATFAPAVKQHYPQVTGKLEADYRLTSETLLYASASRGVKSGGFTAYNTESISQLQPFKPEVLYAYEGGVKSQFLSDTLRLNGDGFYYDYHNQQVQDAIYDPQFGAIGKIVNANSSFIWGLEGEAEWRPIAQLQVSQAISYKRGEFRDFEGLDIARSSAVNSAQFDDRAGQDLGFPKLGLNGSASYTQPVAGTYEVVAEADYAYRGKLTPVLLGPTFDVSDYWLANATLTLRPVGGRWSFGLYGRNITGTRYDLTRNFFLQNVDIAAPGAPATFGGRVTYSY